MTLASTFKHSDFPARLVADEAGNAELHRRLEIFDKLVEVRDNAESGIVRMYLTNLINWERDTYRVGRK